MRRSMFSYTDRFFYWHICCWVVFIVFVALPHWYAKDAGVISALLILITVSGSYILLGFSARALLFNISKKTEDRVLQRPSVSGVLVDPWMMNWVLVVCPILVALAFTQQTRNIGKTYGNQLDMLPAWLGLALVWLTCGIFNAFWYLRLKQKLYQLSTAQS